MAVLKHVAIVFMALVATWAVFVTVPRLVDRSDGELKKRISELEAQLSQALQNAQGVDEKRVVVHQPSPLPSTTHERRPVVSRQSNHTMSLTLDMIDLFGYDAFLYGVSWSPHVCYASFKTLYPKLGEAGWKAIGLRYVKAMQTELGALFGVPYSDVDPDKTYMQQISVRREFAARGKREGWLQEAAPEQDGEPPSLTVSQMALDPMYLEWRRRLSLLMSAWYLDVPNIPYLHCPPSVPKGLPISPEQIGNVSCRGILPDRQIINEYGYAFMPHWAFNLLNKHLTLEGLCTAHPYGHYAGWGEFIVQERLTNPHWATYKTLFEPHDKIIALYDLIYERSAAFTKQYFMGVITMQNPPDMYAISDIIFTMKPDLIIETGTANGGGALMWAGIMELADCPDTARIITLDVNPPTWEKKKSWGGHVRDDPTAHKLWKKRVTFIKGSTIEPNVVAQVRKAAGEAKRVMVLLDSDHSASHVFSELSVYCPLVSIGQYCIVEDTKMSRWGVQGPLPAIKHFLQTVGKGLFEVDRLIEPFHTHHAQGYLVRKQNAPDQTIVGPTQEEVDSYSFKSSVTHRLT